MELTLDRMKHSLSVATKMKEIVLNSAKKFDCKPDEAYVLGLIHDIGYEFSSEQKEHAKKGGLVLKEQGYKHWQEVFYHGVFQNEYDSSLLSLLNYVDMITGPTGEYITIQERINDIAKRYGQESWQVLEAKALGDALLRDKTLCEYN